MFTLIECVNKSQVFSILTAVDRHCVVLIYEL